MKLVKYRVKDGLALVALASPPVNVLSKDMREQLSEVFHQISQNPNIKAVALTGEGVTFSAGSDLRDLEHLDDAPSLRDVCLQVENCSVPVVVGLHGMVMSGGLELALACHYRIANNGTRFAMPEVTLGLTPMAGATQRLPRVVGIGPSIEMLVLGRQVDVEGAKKLGLIDGVVSGDDSVIRSAAFRFAGALVEQGKPVRKSSERHHHLGDRNYFKALHDRSALMADSPLNAPRWIVEDLEAAGMMPFDIGLNYEADRWERALGDPQSRALRRLFAAERRIPDNLIHKDKTTNRKSLGPQGTEIVKRMQRAQIVACETMASNGIEKADIDQALIEMGLTDGYFETGGHGAVPERTADARARLIAAMTGEGVRCLRDRLCDRAASVDAVVVFGMGYSRWLGGPMHSAGQEPGGLLHLRNQMREWSKLSPVWSVPSGMDEAVKYAGGLDVLSPKPVV